MPSTTQSDVCKGGYALVAIGIPSLTHCQRLEHIDKLRP